MAALDWSQCPAVESIPGKVSGAWVLKGTRMPVSVIFENLKAGANLDDIMEWFEGLHRQQVEAVIDLKNGNLLQAAEEAGFEVLVTPDKNIRYQQNLKNYKIAIVVLSKPQWPVLRNHVDRVVAAVNAATRGSYCEVEIPER